MLSPISHFKSILFCSRLPVTNIVKDSKISDSEPVDANYKTEVKHFVQVPKPTRRITEVSFPVAGACATSAAPLPPR